MTETHARDYVYSKIRNIPNFPKPGILFRDITTALKDPKALGLIIDWFYQELKNQQIDCIVGLESRGFIFAPTIAYKLGIGFVPIRKPGKLPAAVEKACYQLEYGKDSLEIHQDALLPGQRVAVIDDLLATGGTACAAAELITKIGGTVVAMAFLMELSQLGGRKKLPQTSEVKTFITC